MNSRQPEDQRLGEVVESSTDQFTTHCYRLYVTPSLGSLVVARDDALSVFGVVSAIQSGSLVPGRQPMPRGQDEKTIDDIYQRNPQLSQLLASRFQAQAAGFQSGDALTHGLPPHPPRIYAFVYQASQEELISFVQSLDFLGLLLLQAPPLADEVVAAFLRHAASGHPNPDEFRLRAGQELSRLLAADLSRLNSLLKRIRP